MSNYFFEIVLYEAFMFFLYLDGAHDRSRTGEPLPYQGSALPTELRGLFFLKNPRPDKTAGTHTDGMETKRV